MAKNKHDPNVRTERLPCDLTPDEVRHRGEQLAEVESDLELLELDRKDAMDGFKTSKKESERRRDELVEQIRGRSESRDVRVKDQLDSNQQEMVTVRLDTGEEVRRRPLTDHERQRGFFDVNEGEKAEGAES